MDVFEFAIEKERHSENHYRELAARTAYPGFKTILTMLADEEVKHAQTIRAMQAANPPARVTDVSVLDNAVKMFDRMRASTETFQFTERESDLYREACNFEKQSKEYYLQKAREVEDPTQRDLFLRLAKEENKHLLLMEKLCDFVARPETFLENAEMYHFDDYVEGVF